MKKIIIVALLLATNYAFAQNVMSLYNMRHIPQVVYANPSFIPLGRINVSIPGLGSQYAQIGKSDFVTKDVATVDELGTLRLDVNKFLNGLEDENLIYAASNLEALHIGFSVNKNYFFLASNDRLTAEFVFPKELAVLITEVYDEKGLVNGHSIEDTRVQYSHVREFSFGWARSITNDLNIGLRVKLLSGIANIRTNSSAFVIENPNSGSDLASLIDINMQTSGMENYSDYAENPLRAISGYSNYGYALDFGFDYKLNSKSRIAASVIDLMGTVHWKDNINNYVAENVEVDFNTINWNDLVNPGSSDGLNGIYDSIIANVDPTQGELPYETITPTKVLASYGYFLTPKIELTLLGEGVFAKHYFEPRLRIGIQGRVKRFLNYMVSYAIVDDQEEANNLGVGFALNLGPLQIHALTDNIFDPLLYNNSFNPSLRVGLNLTMNRDYR